MASTTTASESVVYSRRYQHVRHYTWPALQLNFWMMMMLVASCAIMGIFASFIQVQLQLQLLIPWYVCGDETRGTLSQALFPLPRRC